MRILHLGTPTPNDANYYFRWEVLGSVSQTETDPDVIVTDQYTVIDHHFMSQFKNVEYVCSPTTGHTHLKFSPKRHNVTLITLRGEKEFMRSITSVAEYTMYLILKCAREMASSPLKLSGKTIGIIGKGRVGTQVGAICEAMGMNVSYFDKGHNRHYLKSIFRYSDFISIHLSEDLTTKGFVSRMYIELMRDNAFLINTARSSIVDEGAVRDVILSNSIGGYASDVTSLTSPINIRHPKVFISDHIGGRCLEDRISTDQFIVDKLIKHRHNTQLH